MTTTPVATDKPVYLGTVSATKPEVVTMNSSFRSGTIESATGTKEPYEVITPATPAPAPAAPVSVSNKLPREIYFDLRMDKSGKYKQHTEQGAATWFDPDTKETKLYALHKGLF